MLPATHARISIIVSLSPSVAPAPLRLPPSSQPGHTSWGLWAPPRARRVPLESARSPSRVPPRAPHRPATPPGRSRWASRRAEPTLRLLRRSPDDVIADARARRQLPLQEAELVQRLAAQRLRALLPEPSLSPLISYHTMSSAIHTICSALRSASRGREHLRRRLRFVSLRRSLITGPLLAGRRLIDSNYNKSSVDDLELSESKEGAQLYRPRRLRRLH